MTIGHDTHAVPDPFLVMATQNPIESEGTYPLPEAQVDRFMLKVVVGLSEPRRGAHRRAAVAGEPGRRPAGARARLAEGACSAPSLDVYVDPSLVAYAVSLAEATRRPDRGRPRRDRRPRRVRRQPARPDLARPERPGAGADPRSGLRARRRRPRAGQGRAAASARAHLPGPRRAADGRRRARRRARAALPRRRSSSGGRSPRDGTLRAFGVVETPERPGPGPMPEPLLRALELSIGRRVDGLLAGDHRSQPARPGQRARAGPAVRARATTSG